MKKTALLSLLALMIMGGVNAQQINRQSNAADGLLSGGKTILKSNVLGWATRNFGFYGEQIISKNISAVLGVNIMPQGGVPYISRFSDDPQLEDIRIGTFSFTPEVRFYLSRSGYGKGFYIAPYYKYERFKASNLLIEFEDQNSVPQEINLKGNLNTHSGGAIIGIQWLAGKKKRIALDWTIIGAHYGTNKALFNGTSSHEMSAEEQASLKQEIIKNLNDIEIGGKKIAEVERVDVSSTSAEAKTKGPWAFIRSSFSIGYRF